MSPNYTKGDLQYLHLGDVRLGNVRSIGSVSSVHSRCTMPDGEEGGDVGAGGVLERVL